MTDHAHSLEQPNDNAQAGPRFGAVARTAGLVGVAGIVAAAALAAIQSDGRRFFHAYLTNYVYFLSFSLGGLFFVLLQHVTRAGWSVNVRRPAEWMAMTLPLMALLAIPILVVVLLNNGALYPWAQDPRNLDSIVLGKRAYLNPVFFSLRLIGYLAVWSLMGIWYWRQSVRQDDSGDATLTRSMEKWSAPGLVVYAVTVTLASFDLLMSLDPHWYSTIFGVYYFSGAAVGMFAAMVVIARLLQRGGLLTRSITTEHYHDLGKFLFGFVFFWGYIAFSQYMLLWYANMPEGTAWLLKRGATTAAGDQSGWTVVSVLLLLGMLLLPFAGLISRRAKRNGRVLGFWALWLLVFHWIDMYWLVMPSMGRDVRLGLPELLTLLGIGGLYVAVVASVASRAGLRPQRDPRIEESMQFVNV